MKRKVGLIIVIIVLLGILGTLGGLLWYQSASAEIPQQNDVVSAPTAPVSKGTIVDEVSGSGELKGGVNEKLEMAKWRYFKAFVAPRDVRIPAGTPLVEYTNGESLVAPYDCVMTSWNLPKEKWDELTGEHFVEVSRVDVMNMELEVHENDIARLAVGQPAQVTLASDEGRTYEGTITKIAQVGSYQATGSKYKVTVEFTNDGVAMLGMSATAKIVVGEAADVLCVPVSAVNDGPDGPYLMVKKGESTVSVPVTTGLSDTAKVEVSGDIAEGDEVVLNEAFGSDEAGILPAGVSAAPGVGGTFSYSVG